MVVRLVGNLVDLRVVQSDGCWAEQMVGMLAVSLVMNLVGCLVASMAG